MPSKIKTHMPRLVLLFAMTVLAACAAVTPESKKDVIVERAEARWVAMLSGDLQTAYSYLSPGYRSKVPYEDYVMAMRLRRVVWTSADYLDHSCDGDICTVRFKTGFKVNRPVPGLDVYNGTQEVEEQWLKIDGQWWHLPKT
jgi:hypothetical protein